MIHSGQTVQLVFQTGWQTITHLVMHCYRTQFANTAGLTAVPLAAYLAEAVGWGAVFGMVRTSTH